MAGYRALLVIIITFVGLASYSSCRNVLDHEIDVRALPISISASHHQHSRRVQGNNVADDREEEVEARDPGDLIEDLEDKEAEDTTNGSRDDQIYLPNSARTDFEYLASSRSSSSSPQRTSPYRYSERFGSAEFRGRSNSPTDAQLRTLEVQRARAREMRKIEFQKKILRELQMSQAPKISVSNKTREEIINKINQLSQLSQVMPLHTDCYRAACSAPVGMNTSLWYSPAPSAMRLNFRLPRLNRKRQNKEVEKAKLNLFFKPRDGCPCNDEFGSYIMGYRVEVKQFMKKLIVRRNRVRNRTMYLDSVNVPLSGNARISLDVTKAVKLWMERPRRNMGLEVRVTHFNGTEANASDIFVQTSCYSNKTRMSCSNHRGGLDGNFSIEMVHWPSASFHRGLQEFRGRPFLEVRLSNRGSRRRTGRGRSGYGRQNPVVIANSLEDLMQRT